MIQPCESHSTLKRVIYTMVAPFISSHPCLLPLLSLLHHLCTFILFLSFLRLIKYLLFLGPGLFIFWSVFSAVAGPVRWLNSAVSDVLSVWLSSWGRRLGRVRGSECAINIGSSPFRWANWACEPHTLWPFTVPAHTG